MPTFSSHPRALLVLAWALAACTAQAPDETGGTSASASVHLHALAACGEANPTDPFKDIGQFDLMVQDESGKRLRIEGRSAVRINARGSKSYSVAGIPAGPGRTITLIGYQNGSGAAAWFARKRGVKVLKNSTLQLDLTMMKLGGYTCLAKSSGAIVNVAFPELTAIDGGRVLVTGGYAVAEDDKSGKYTNLTSARDDAFILDPNTGELRDPVQKNRMKARRGAHRAIYLPKRSEVLIVGGAMQMKVPKDKSGPPSWKVTSGVNVAFETLDLGKDEQGKSREVFDMPQSTEFVDKLVLPTLMPLADDYVVALGGAEWPASSAANKMSYKHSDLFDPQEGEHGSFIKVAGALPLNSVRAGAAIAFIDTTEEGGSRYLIWGGSEDASSIAEVFREDTQPGGGVFDAQYEVTDDILGKNKKGSLYFATLTPLGATAQDQGRFLSVGGIRYHGGKWLPPDPEDVYLVTLKEEKGKPRKLITKRIGGFGKLGVFLHQASLTDAKHVLISGGFSSFGGAAAFTMRVYDVETGTFSEPPAAATFIKRGAHAALRLNNDCVLMWGGVSKWADLDGKSAVVSDIYCPTHLGR